MVSFSARAAAFVKLCLFSLVIAMALLGPGLASADGFRPFNRIVVFGDSLSDTGNLFALTNGAVVAGPTYGMDGFDANGIPEIVSLIPEFAYKTQRFSNGPTWIELLGTAFGTAANVKPAFADPRDRRRFNFAVAGATAANLVLRNPDEHPFHLSVQVGAYLDRVTSAKPSDDTLYVIAIGGNDLRAVFTYGPDVLEDALKSIQKNVTDLYLKAGARKFLIWNIPNVGATPAFQRLQNGVAPSFPGIPGIAHTATALIEGPPNEPNAGYNDILKQLLAGLSAGLPGIQILHFDAFASLQAVLIEPRRYGLLDASSACIRPHVPDLGILSSDPWRCEQPDRHFFWDGIHPTRAGHAIIAFLVGKDLVKALLQDH